jgi:hypothetical protein
MEGDINVFIDFIFGGDPQPECSIDFIVKDYELDGEDNYEKIKTLFDILLLLFNGGMKLRYGKLDGRVHLSELNEAVILEMKNYFKSIGFKLNVEISDEERPYGTAILYNDKLEDCCMYLISNETKLTYKINFSNHLAGI